MKEQEKPPASGKEEKEILKELYRTIQEFSSRITGKNIEEKLTEYTEVFGEILIYLYKQQEEQKQRLKAIEKEKKHLEEELKKLKAGIPQSQEQKHRTLLPLILTILNFMLLFFLVFLLWK